MVKESAMRKFRRKIEKVNKMNKMTSIYIYGEDLQKLMAMATWKKFKGCSYADIIG